MNGTRTALAVVVTALLVVGCSTTANDTPPDPGLFVARIDEVPDDSALYSSTHGLYLVDTPEEGLLALSERDPFLGCRITALDPADRNVGHPGVNFETTWFADPCHGSEYDRAGRYLGGPSPRSMDRWGLEVIAGRIYLDPAVGPQEMPHPEDTAE